MVQTRGSGQAEKYLRMLNQPFETLAHNPELGRIYDEVYSSLRVYPSGGIDVVRLLHERMDIPSHL